MAEKLAAGAGAKAEPLILKASGIRAQASGLSQGKGRRDQESRSGAYSGLHRPRSSDLTNPLIIRPTSAASRISASASISETTPIRVPTVS
jgi:hypothetical protein